MTRLGLAFLLVSCLAVPLGTNAQKPATLMGNVYYADDFRPARSVVVSLSDSEHVQLETQATTDNGEFRFGGLKRANYTVSINASGYEPVTLSVDISFGSDKGIAI